MVDASDSKSDGSDVVGVRVPSWVLKSLTDFASVELFFEDLEINKTIQPLFFRSSASAHSWVQLRSETRDKRYETAFHLTIALKGGREAGS